MGQLFSFDFYADEVETILDGLDLLVRKEEETYQDQSFLSHLKALRTKIEEGS